MLPFPLFSHAMGCTRLVPINRTRELIALFNILLGDIGKKQTGVNIPKNSATCLRSCFDAIKRHNYHRVTGILVNFIANA